MYTNIFYDPEDKPVNEEYINKSPFISAIFNQPDDSWENLFESSKKANEEAIVMISA